MLHYFLPFAFEHTRILVPPPPLLLVLCLVLCSLKELFSPIIKWNLNLSSCGSNKNNGGMFIVFQHFIFLDCATV